MMSIFEKLDDIAMVIREGYEDKEPLTESQKDSFKCFMTYCNEIKKELRVLDTLKPICEVIITPKGRNRYLKINGVVVYTFKSKEEYDLFCEVLNEEKD